MKHFKKGCTPQHLTFNDEGLSGCKCMNCGARDTDADPAIGYYTTSAYYDPNGKEVDIRIPVYAIRNTSHNGLKWQALVKDTGLESMSWINIKEDQYFDL